MEIWRPEIDDLRWQLDRNKMDRDEYGSRVRGLIAEWVPIIEQAVEATGIHVAAMTDKFQALTKDRRAYAELMQRERRYCTAKNLSTGSPLRYLVPRVEYRRVRPSDIIGARVVLDPSGLTTDEWIVTLGAPVVRKGTVDGRDEWLRVTNNPDDPRLGRLDKLGVMIGVEAILDNTYQVGQSGCALRLRIEPPRKRKRQEPPPQE